MNYSDFTFTHYTGADCWGTDTTDEQREAMDAELESRVKARFPGIEVQGSIDPYRSGVAGRDEDAREEIENTIHEIIERVCALEPEPTNE